MKKKKITKKPTTRVHAFRCTDEVWSKLKELAKDCGISLNRYLTKTGLKHHPRKRLTKDEVNALKLSGLCQDGPDKNHQCTSRQNGRGKVETLQNREVHDMVD